MLYRGGQHYEHGGQRKRTKYTVPQVDKGTSLHCYYVKMCRTGEYACDTCSTHFYIKAVKGCSFVYLRNCIFCPLSLFVMFIVQVAISSAVGRIKYFSNLEFKFKENVFFYFNIFESFLQKRDTDPLTPARGHCPLNLSSFGEFLCLIPATTRYTLM